MRQARPTWDLERALRRRLLTEYALAALGGLVIFAGAFLFFVWLFTL